MFYSWDSIYWDIIFHMCTMNYGFHFIQILILKPLMHILYSELTNKRNDYFNIIFKILKVKINPYFSACRYFVLIIKVEKVIFCRLMHIIILSNKNMSFHHCYSFLLTSLWWKKCNLLVRLNVWYESLSYLLN